MPTPTQPIDYNVIRTTLVSAVMGGTGLSANNVIMLEPEVPNSPRPNKPYMTIKLVTLAVPFGTDVMEYVPSAAPGDPDAFNYGGPRAMTASFNSYGQTHWQAYNVMALWQSALNQEPTQSALGTAGIAFWKAAAILDLSELLNTGFEGRAQMDVDFGISYNSQVAVDTIGQVTVQGSVRTDQGVVVHTDTTIAGI